MLEAAITLGNIWYFTPVGIILGFVLMAVALARFGDYLLHKKNTGLLSRNSENIERMKGWLNNQYQLTQSIKDLHDHRFHRMETKKIELDDKIDSRYRELAGKIMDVENRLNLVSRVLISQRDVFIPAPPVTKAVEKPAVAVKDFFEDVWGKVTEMAEKNGYIDTLSRGVRNRVLEMGKNGMKIRSELTQKERFISKDDFRHFWNHLQGGGKLDIARDIQDPGLLRTGSVIISFLARLPNVEHDLKPRVLYLLDGDTHNLGTLRRRKKI